MFNKKKLNGENKTCLYPQAVMQFKACNKYKIIQENNRKEIQRKKRMTCAVEEYKRRPVIQKI